MKKNKADKYLADGKSDAQRFREWVLGGGEIIDRSAYMIDGEIALDFFIRFENLHLDIATVCEHIGVPYIEEELPRLKTGFRDSSRTLPEMYDRKTADTVRDLYQFEIEYFDYKLA